MMPPKHITRLTSRELLFFLIAVVCVVLCVGFTIYFFTNPPAYPFQLKNEGIHFTIWSSEKVQKSRWFFLLAAVLLSGTALYLTTFLGKKAFKPAAPRASATLDVLAPLALLPLACIPLFIPDKMAPILSTNLPLFILLGGLSLFLAKLVTPLLDSPSKTDRHTSVIAFAIFVVALSAYAHYGYNFSKTVGEHLGDEGHYIIMAQSLYEDGDLDLKNQILARLGEDDSPKIHRGAWHIADASRGDAMYSWHPYGLSLLLAPLWKWGLGARHIMLGVISGAGLAGLFLLSRRMGAGNLASLLAVLSLGTSVYWVIYSFRALPEVLGGTLAIWTFWAIAAQRDRPWTSALVAAACCVYLPFSHARFIPMSLMGMGLYGLVGLLGNEKLQSKIFRLAIFSLLCFLGYAFYQSMQFALFTGGTHTTIKGTLFTHPFGAWGILAIDRGLISLLPVFFWIFAASILWFFVDKGNRIFSVGTITFFFACLIINTTNPWYTGGSSMPGRYLVAVVPLLFVGLAVMLERVNLWARTWFFFLSLFSFSLYYLMWIHLPDIGRSFILPLHVLSSFPLLQDLYFPHAYFFDNKTDIFWTTFYVVYALLATTLIIFLRKSFLFFSFFGIIVILCAGLIIQNSFDFERFSFQRHMELLEIKDTHFIQVEHASSRYPWTEVLDVHRMHTSGRNCTFESMQAKCASQGVDSAGIFAWGAYKYVFPGNFRVNFKYNISNCNNELKIATLDIASDSGKTILGVKDIFCSNTSESESLFFQTNSFLLIEPRVHYHGNGDIILHHVSIQEVVE